MAIEVLISAIDVRKQMTFPHDIPSRKLRGQIACGNPYSRTIVPTSLAQNRSEIASCQVNEGQPNKESLTIDPLGPQRGEPL